MTDFWESYASYDGPAVDPANYPPPGAADSEASYNDFGVMFAPFRLAHSRHRRCHRATCHKTGCQAEIDPFERVSLRSPEIDPFALK